jgi:carbon-monoxide dehydrogenase medium subunit
VYPPKFDYVAPTTVDEALGLLAERGEDGKILAGGQSLIPVLKLRFNQPEVLIDINGVEGLTETEETDDEIVIGALARHNGLAYMDMMESRFPIIAEAGKLVADPLVRNLGTIGGSLAHADPQADWGSVMLAMNASFVIQKKGASRTQAATDFFQGIFTTSLETDELLTHIRVPKPTGPSGGAYLKMERKVGDFATAAVGVHLEMDGAHIKTCGIGLTGVGVQNLKAVEAENALAGQAPSPELFAEAAELAAKITEPKDDVRGTAAFKRNVVKTFVVRGLERAVAFARNGAQSGAS